ncbi:MAG: glycosyltransferase [Pyrinomonadaceae bacterium]
MKIGIYNQPSSGGIGGSESVAAFLAEALAGEHQVDLLHHIGGLSADVLEGALGANLRGVQLCYVEPEYGDRTPYFRNPWRRYQSARDWYAGLSEPYDLFIAIVHFTPPFCHARNGALIVLFPFDTADHIRPPAELATLPAYRRQLELWYQRWVWQKRMSSYAVKTAISNFSHLWTRRRWAVDCEIVYPPVASDFQQAVKSKIVLSVGRFALEGEGHTKRQPEMLTSFREMAEAGTSGGWQYYCAGGLRDTPRHQEFFRTLFSMASATQAHVIANARREELKGLFARASIFWHAAGYGEDEQATPELAEHFGISTVEAMAAGCVPVVINKGGQSEIVQHGLSGFLWNTLDELKEYTALLISDEALRKKMSEAARERAQLFEKQNSLNQHMSLLQPLLS